MGRPYLALGRMVILYCTPWSTRIVVFSVAFRERLLDAVKKPMPVRLLSTLAKELARIREAASASNWFSAAGCGGWLSTGLVDLPIPRGVATTTTCGPQSKG